MNFRPFPRPFFDELASIATPHWAKSRPNTARVLIGAGVLLAIFALKLGVSLLSMGIELPKWSLFFMANGFIVATIFYPLRAEFAVSSLFHRRRRRFDAALLLLGGAATVFFANRLTADALRENNFREKPHFQSAAANGHVVLASLASDRPDKTPAVFAPKESKSNFFERLLQKRLVKKFHKTALRDPSKAEQVLWVVLLIALILGFQYLLAVWACNLSCGGMEGLAALVTLGGWAGLTVFSTWVLRYIFPEKTRKNRIWLALLMVLFLPLLSILSALMA